MDVPATVALVTLALSTSIDTPRARRQFDNVSLHSEIRRPVAVVPII